jgi:beta-N-acetylhexosaminidase
VLKTFLLIFCFLISGCHQERSQMTITQPPSPSLYDINESQLTKEIGQMIMIGFQGTKMTDPEVQEALRLAREGKIGGVIFFGYNILNPQQVRKLTSAFQQAQPRLLIAIDQEGGRVQRLSSRNGFKDFPSAKEVADTQTPLQASQIYLKMAQMIKSAGFNLNFAPVVDLHADPAGHESPVIGKIGRSYSEHVNKVIDYASAFINAHRQVGVLTSLKHFPGHGYARQDSHKGMVDITITSSPEEQTVFYRLIEAGKVDTIMSGHLMHRKWDVHYPATLSSNVLKNYLRDPIKYDGIIITDDLHMGAIGQHYNLEEIVTHAVHAGNDILLFSNNKAAAQGVKKFKASTSLAQKIHALIIKAIKEKKLSMSKIHEASLRIDILKKRFFQS